MSEKIDYNCWFTRGETEGNNILILEDNLELQSSIRDFLILRGYKVYTAKDGAEGIRQVLAMDFDAIICDMVMPKFPGDKFYLATSRVKSYLCERFIFITAESSNSSVAEFIRSVNGTVLFKPFRLDDLALSVANTYNKRSVGRVSDSETVSRMESVQPREETERYFFGTICSVDTTLRRFVLYQGTRDRVWTLECVFPEKLKHKVLENLNMRVCVLGTTESVANGRRQVVNIRNISLANGPLKSVDSTNSDLGMRSAA